MLTEQRLRMQSRPKVVPLRKGRRGSLRGPQSTGAGLERQLSREPAARHKPCPVRHASYGRNHSPRRDLASGIPTDLGHAGESEQLAKIVDKKIGLVIALPSEPHVVGIAESVSVFAPHDPLSNGLLNGAFKNGGHWSSIVKHWAHLQWPSSGARSSARTIRVWFCNLLQTRY